MKIFEFMENLLEVEKLHKNYGHITAVSQLSMEVEKGAVYGILGPNGSGKTTTLGILLGAVTNFRGTYSWFGNGTKDENRKRVGSILEQANFYENLSGKNNLTIMALYKGVDENDIFRVAKIVGLEDRLNDKFKTYSLGMKQRLGIGAALLGNPEVLVLDEPTNGLDPKGIVDIRNLIQKVSDEGITVLLASHALDEVQKVCSHVCIVQNGVVKSQGKFSDVVSGGKTIEVSSGDMEALKTHILAFGVISEEDLTIERNKILINLNGQFEPNKLIVYLVEKGVEITFFSTRSKSLEEFFIKTTES